jgi:flavin reductase (DIM6/NTAB) family NADH-FMN oxidoreductase RutF
VLFYEPHRRDRQVLPHDPFKALVTPRPVGWISTVGPDGEVNLAPYSFFNAVAEGPLMLAFSSQGPKDSATFAGGVREFVWNLATYALREEMNRSSAPLPRGHSEFEHAGLEMAECRLVSAPRVAASPCAMECRVVDAIDLRDVDGNAIDQYLVIGQVVGIHLDEAYLRDGLVDTAAMQPIARCGYLDEYAVVDRLFHMPRPRGAEPREV